MISFYLCQLQTKASLHLWRPNRVYVNSYMASERDERVFIKFCGGRERNDNWEVNYSWLAPHNQIVQSSSLLLCAVCSLASSVHGTVVEKSHHSGAGIWKRNPVSYDPKPIVPNHTTTAAKLTKNCKVNFSLFSYSLFFLMLYRFILERKCFGFCSKL